MKIDELFEALPGVAKPSLFSRIFGGGQDAKVKASIDQGTKAWIAFAKNLASQGKITTATLPPQYSEIFRLWSANAMNLPPKHPAMNQIVQELATELASDNSEKPIKNAVTKLVNLSQTLAAGGPEARYTPEMKAQAVINVLDKQYGKYIKDIATKQAFVKFVKDTITANPNISVNDLKDAAEAEIGKLVTGSTGNPPGGGPPSIPGGTTQTAGGVEYVWNGSEWRNSTTGAAATAAISAALTASVTGRS